MSVQEQALSFLLELGKRISEEDNLATQDPIFVVKEKAIEAGIDPDYHYDGTVWFDEGRGEEADGETAGMLDLIPESEIPSRYEKRYYREVDRWVQPMLTREAAENYIIQNAHNLRKPFIYVESAYRNHQVIGLRKIALDLYRAEKGEGS
jgi:hypothetical protein